MRRVPFRRLVPPRARQAAIAAGTLLALPLAATPAHAAKKPTSVSTTAGGVTATVTYRNAKGRTSYLRHRHLRLTVTGPTGGLSKVTLPKAGNSYARPQLELADLTGDGVPDPIVSTYTGGAHCCTNVSIALSFGGSWTRPTTEAWGDYPPVVKDLGGAPGMELGGADDRFAYAFASYAASIPAIRIVGARGGQLVDVTREYPDAVRADAAERAALLRELLGKKLDDLAIEDAQSAAAGLIADHLLAGDADAAKGVIAQLRDAGALDGDSWTGKTFPKLLVKNLTAWGYLTSASQIGL